MTQCSVAGVDFQACSIDHSDISPFRINDLRAARNSLSQNPPSNGPVPRCDLHSAVCGHGETERRRNCVRPPNVPRSLTAILLSRRAQIVGYWQAAVAKKIDVFATALHLGMTVDDISDLI